MNEQESPWSVRAFRQGRSISAHPSFPNANAKPGEDADDDHLELEPAKRLWLSESPTTLAKRIPTSVFELGTVTK